MPSYKLTKSAEKDLREIYKYSFETWGEKQADIYITKIENRLKNLKSRNIINKEFSDVYKSLKSNHCEHHYGGIA